MVIAMLYFEHCDGGLYCPGVRFEIINNQIATFAKDGKELNRYHITTEQQETLRAKLCD